MVNEGNCSPMQGQMGNDQSRSARRPFKNVSLAVKLDAIDRVRNGKSKASVARDIGVPESTLRGWCKSEQKIRSLCNGQTDTMPRYSPDNIDRRRSMSANGRQSANSWLPSDSRPWTNTPPGVNDCIAKRARIDGSGREDSPQYAIAGPSSSADYFMGGVNSRSLLGPNCSGRMAAAAVSRDQNQTVASGLNPLSILPVSSGLAEQLMLQSAQRGNTVGLVESGLRYRNNTAFPGMINNATIASNATNNGSDESVCNEVDNTISNAEDNPLDYSINSRNIVAPTTSTPSWFAGISPIVTPGEEAPTTPAPASPHESYAQSTTSMGATVPDDVVHMAAICARLLQQIRENQLFTNNDALSAANDDNGGETRARSRSVTSEESDSHGEGEDSSITGATAEATLTTPPAELSFPPQMQEILRSARTPPNNSQIDKAIEYARWLYIWLNTYSIPLLTIGHRMQQKHILNVLEWTKAWQSLQIRTQTEAVPEGASSESQDEETQP